MSKAFKCDRCKKCFDPQEEAGGKSFARIREIIFQNSDEFNEGVTSERYDERHLCRTCAGYFRKFMNNDPYAHYASPIRNVIHLEDEERTEAYEKGVQDGIAAVFNQLFGSESVFKNHSFGIDGDVTDSDSTDEAPERTKRSKKDSEH